MNLKLYIRIIWACHIHLVLAVIPTGELKLRKNSNVVYVAPGGFGKPLIDESLVIYRKLLIPDGDSTGCNPTVPLQHRRSEYYFLVGRGNCSFEEKAMAAADAGAKAVVIYNSLLGIYQDRDYALDMDYECRNGHGYISELIYPVYSDEMDDAMPEECTADTKCSSGRCVITNMTDSNGIKVCCAWDLYITMGSSDDFDDNAISIPAVFIRMTDKDTLFSYPELDSMLLDVLLYDRPTSVIDFASVLIWLIAICTISIGATKAAEEDKVNCDMTKDILGISPHNRDDESDAELENNHDHRDSADDIRRTFSGRIQSNRYENESDAGSTVGNNYGALNWDNIFTAMPVNADDRMSVRSTNSVMGDDHHNTANDDSMDVSVTQAIGFIFISSGFLLLLYFVNLYAFVTVMYLFASSFACGMVVIQPCFAALCYNPDGDEPTVAKWKDNSIAFLSFATGAGLGCLWYFYQNASWAWLLQDTLGVSVCIMFLSAVRLPNLQVATILLSLACFYDMFFVFISPYVFNSSVMITVAEGPTSSFETNDENYCEKYPDDEYCSSNTLPMLITVPSISSYVSSESMLGLGDIVLPGLLVVFCARLDMRNRGTLSNLDAVKEYFPMVIIAYAIGLLMANLAVEYFEYGQPALIYIVPLTLGSVLQRAYSNGTLPLLWVRLPSMKTVAVPVDVEEQEALLGRSQVVRAEASWRGNARDVNAILLGLNDSDESMESKDNRDKMSIIGSVTSHTTSSADSGESYDKKSRRSAGFHTSSLSRFNLPEESGDQMTMTNDEQISPKKIPKRQQRLPLSTNKLPGLHDLDNALLPHIDHDDEDEDEIKEL